VGGDRPDRSGTGYCLRTRTRLNWGRDCSPARCSLGVGTTGWGKT
jgi:hypothetical protein